MAINYNVPILKMDRIIRKLEMAINTEASEPVHAKLRDQLAHWRSERQELMALIQASAKNAEELQKAKRIKSSTQLPLTFKTKGKPGTSWKGARGFTGRARIIKN